MNIPRSVGRVFINCNGICIIAADTGNGNIKTVSTCIPTSVSRFDTKPITTANVIQYNGSCYVIGQGHKEVISDKTQDEDYYSLTLFCTAKELARDNVTEGSVIIAAGLPGTQNQKGEHKAFDRTIKQVGRAYRRREKSACYADDRQDFPFK
ncbi:MAG: hypothetical protein PUK49_05965 [Oscillospiraceae bacterium]|nr:hypothetical protein [Oscillospiraceae bacterium]